MSTATSANYTPPPPGAGFAWPPTAPTSGADQKRQLAGSVGRDNSTSTSSGSSTYESTRARSQHLSSSDSSMANSMLGLSLSSSPPQKTRTQGMTPPPSDTFKTPSLVFPLPSIFDLKEVQPHVDELPIDAQVSWIRDILYLATRATSPSPSSAGTDLQTGPIIFEDTELQLLADSAVAQLLKIVPTVPTAGTRMSKAKAEALYIRATLTASGAFPTLIPQNSRVAFRTFEAAARAGHHAAWFRLGRDYEAFGDSQHAKDCFERGARPGSDDVSCLYRLGMARLMGQLDLPVDPERAMPLLHRAATLATLAVPQPAYVYALLLLDDFAHIGTSLPASLFAPYLPSGVSISEEAQKHLERAAYLHFSPAQYKLGHSYEFARPPCAFDPLLSVQYYTLASGAGEPEADMALSKWFLCGAEGAFSKDEPLAFTFAERAARSGLASAEFAMGYYLEVGIGTTADLQRSMRWYEKAKKHGNSDAAERLAALTQPISRVLSRRDHDNLAEQTLVRRRTQAKQRSDAAGSIRRADTQEDAVQVVELVRRASKMQQKTGRRSPRGRRSSVQPPLQNQLTALHEPSSSPPHSLSEQIQPPPPLERMRRSSSPIQTSHMPTFDPARPRYSLVDPGPSRTGSPLRPRDEENSERQTPSSTPSVSTQPNIQKVRYNTFAEMGIQGQKLEEKECVIM